MFRPLFMLWLLLATPITLASTMFPEQMSFEDRQLERVGFGTARYAGLIRIYDAALYAPLTNRGTDVLDTDIPKRLEIVYHKSLEADMLAEAALRILERQHGADVVERWQTQIDQLHAAYRNVAPGDRFALAMSPTYGLRLEFNGQEVAHIEDLEFGRLYFGIWLGEQPLSTTLRDALLPTGCCATEGNP